MSKGGVRPGAGRPRGAKNKQPNYLRELAQQYTEKALQTLAEIMEHGENETARISASKELLDRGYGKAPQALTDEDGNAAEKVSFVIVKK